jgi:cytochrome P450
MARDDPFHPPPEYASLRNNAAVVQANLGAEGRRVWLVMRFEEAKQVLTDTRFSSDSRHPSFPVRRTYSALIRMDPPEHTRYRRMLNAEFSSSRMRELSPAVVELTKGLLDGMATGPQPTDFMRAVAMPLPSLVICHLLGVPADDRDFLTERTAAALQADASQSQIDQAVADLGEYMDDVVRAKARHPGDDLLGRLIRNHVERGQCTLDTAADLARLLLVAGHVTTVNMIGLGMLVLLRHPDQLAKLRRHPDRIERAVEELLRHLSITATLSRVATADIEVGGVLIREGEPVMVLLSSCNRDERAFDRPDALDLFRSAEKNLAFGWGPHLCLGAALARLELGLVLNEVIRRFPSLRVAVPLEEIPFREKVLIYGVHELPVTW